MLGGGGSKPPAYKAPNSYLGNLSQTRTVTPFADTNSRFRNKRDVTTGKRMTGKNAIELYSETTPSAFMQEGIDQGAGLMNSNLAYLNQTPDQRFASITGGNDLYYNALRGQLDLQNQQAMGRAQLGAASRGMVNSTAQGGAIAGIQNDALRREREAQLAAFGLGQQTATGNVGTGLGVLSGINNIISPQQQVNQTQLGGLRTTGEQINQQNAMAKYQSDMARFQQQQANQAAWGQAIGGLSPLGGFIHAGVTGNPAGAVAGSQTFNNVMGAMMPMMGGMPGGGMGGLQGGGSMGSFI